MSHSLHRLGSEEERKHDFVVIMMPSKGINVDGSAPKVKVFLNLAAKNGCVNEGSRRFGNSFKNTLDEIIAKVVDQGTTCTATFDSREKLTQFLKNLKEADLGISVNVSAVTTEISEICEEVGLKPHTRSFSLGVMGKTDGLPDDRYLMLMSMCGHGMVSFNLVKKAVEDVKNGKDPYEAAKFLAKPCLCALYNAPIAASVLKELAEKK